MTDEMKTETKSVDLEAVIGALGVSDASIPEEAIEQARSHKEAIEPLLIRVIEEAVDKVRQGLEVDDNAHFFAGYLLAEFHATAAWPAIRDTIKLPQEPAFYLWGDAITEDMDFILSLVVGDRLEELREVYRDQSLDEFVRLAASGALLQLVKADRLPRDQAIEMLGEDLQAALDADDLFCSVFVFPLVDLGATAKLPLIEAAYEADLVASQFEDLDSVRARLRDGEQAFHDGMKRLRTFSDFVAHLRNWSAFSDDSDEAWDERNDFNDLWDAAFIEDIDLEDEDFSLENDFKDEVDDEPSGATVRSVLNRVGRNEPCPCGSGKKYKKCCGR